MTITLNTRQDFTLETWARVAWGGETIAFGAAATSAMTAARQRFLKLIDQPDITIYGVNTGYGARANEKLSAAQRQAQATEPTYHRAVSFGDDLPDRVTRGIVLARLANFIEGHSAVSLPVAEAVANMLTLTKQPRVPARGQGGAGEILSLSHLFMGLAEQNTLAEKDMLSLINGSPAASALVSDCALAAEARLEIVAQVFAFSAEAFNAPLGHYHQALDSYWNNSHDAWALQKIRALMAGGHGGERRPYQAPVSYRIMPRVLAQAHRASSEASNIATQSLGAVTDNPVMLPADNDHPNGEVISTGGYHNIQAVAAIDAVTAAYANLAVICGRLGAKLLDPTVSKLPAFLGLNEGSGYLGCLPMAIVGYEEELRMLAQPTLLPGSESGGFGQDDIASPIFLAWTKQERAGLLLEQSLASLAPIAARAFHVSGRPVPQPLSNLAQLVKHHFADEKAAPAFGPQCESLALAFRKNIYKLQFT